MEIQETSGGVVTPVENEVVANEVDLEVDQSTAQKETTPPSEDTEAQKEEKTQAEKTFTQAELDEILEKRTAKIARQRDKERERREAHEQELAQLRPKQPLAGKPQLSQFDNDAEAYAEALANWKIDEQVRAINDLDAEKAKRSFSARVNEFKEDLEDVPNVNFDKLVRLKLSDAAIEAMLDSPLRVKLAAHLLTNKSDAERIESISSPARQAVELGKLEVKLSAPVAKKVSQTPAPITPVGARGSAPSSDLYDPKLQANPEEWIKVYNAKQAEKRNSK